MGLKPLVDVAILAVVVDDVHVLAGVHLVQVVHSSVDQALDSLIELLAACH